jgi:hypothetical protein
MLKQRIQNLVQICETLGYRFDSPEWASNNKSLWEGINQLDMEAGTGLAPGRHLKWNVADGYAHYIVVKVGKQLTELAYLPYMDNYQFAGTFMQGNKLMVPTAVATQCASGLAFFRALFDKQKKVSVE